MTPSELYKLWAPDESIWSNWAKPVLFAESGPAVPLSAAGRPAISPAGRPPISVSWAPAVEARTAIILDLEGDTGVWTALALAERGYRPVPLYNGASGWPPIVDVSRIGGALKAGARELGQLTIDPVAPPVFLLDAGRSGGGRGMSPGKFDNRWVVFPQDFPSANALLHHGIRRVVLAQARASVPQPDLAHVLLRWQEAGIQVLGCDPQQDSEPTPMTVARPGNFRRFWYRAMVLAGLRRNSAGGFGAIVPEPGSSGGYG